MLYINAIRTRPEKKHRGRKPLQLNKRRLDIGAMPIDPDIAENARRVVTEAANADVHKIKEEK